VDRWSQVSHTPNTFRFATVSPDGMHWMLRRNCSVTPPQLMWVFLGLSGLSLGVAAFFWAMGATLVLPFAVVELVALGAAFVVYARHATDRERISLCEGQLVVEQESAGKTLRCEFARHAVQVVPQTGGDQLIEVHGGGRSVKVGRFVRSDLRPALAREIRMALRGM
jgi:uncharacterized membrane protein